MQPACSNGNQGQATSMIPEIFSASGPPADIPLTQYIIPLYQTPSYSLQVLTRRVLSDREVQKLTDSFQGRVTIQERGNGILMGPEHNGFEIAGVQILSEAFSAPAGLEDMAPLIDSHSKRLEHEIEEIARCLIEDNRCDHTKYDPASFLIAGAQYIGWLENTLQHPNKEGVKALKTYLLQLHAHYQEKLQQNHLSPLDLLKTCKIDEIPGGTLSGDSYFRIFILMAVEWKNDALGLFEEISLTYTNNLKKLLLALERPAIEIFAGRGMLTAALKEAGCDLHDATDIKRPTQPWAGSAVRAASAEKVVTTLKEGFVYLAAQPELTPLEGVIHLRIPMCMLVSGVELHQGISPVRRGGPGSGSGLKPLVERGQLTVMPLNIPGHTRNASFCGVWLMTANMKPEETSAIQDKVPAEFRLETDPTSTSPCKVTQPESASPQKGGDSGKKKKKK